MRLDRLFTNWLLTTIILPSLLLAIACSPGTAPPTPPAPSPATVPTPAPTPAPMRVNVQYGGMLRVVCQTPPAGYDVHLRPAWGPMMGYPVFNNLVQFDTQKAGLDPRNIVPGLAERWEASADGKTWTFFLYRGVKWHDDKPFTADDVVYNMAKMADAKRSGVVSSFPNFDRSEKVDDYTVKVYLKAPSPDFLVQLAGPYTMILPPQKANVDWRTTDYLVGTGPFMYKSSVGGVSYQLVRNPNYHKKDASGNRLPYLDGVNYLVINDRSAQIDALLTNRVDMTQPSTGISSQELLDRVKSSGRPIDVQLIGSQGSSETFFFNVKDPYLK